MRNHAVALHTHAAHETPAVTHENKNVTAQLTEDSPLRTLLDQLESGQSIAPALIAQARAELEALQPEDAIAWKQPAYRKVPNYTHTITCVMCGEKVTLTTQRAKAPTVCGAPDCQAEKRRIQARIRKRRQRERERRDAGES